MHWQMVIWGIVCFLAVAASHPLVAQEERYGDVVIRRLPGLPEGKLHGYHEFLFELQNLSPERPHDIELRLPGLSLSDRSGLTSLTAQTRVEASSKERLSILQPSLAIRGQEVGVFIDGERQSKDLAWQSEHPMIQIKVAGTFSGSKHAMRLLVGQKTETHRFPEVTEDSLLYLPESFVLLESEIPIEQWSERWLAYSGYDGIILSWEELKAAPIGVERALWSYVEAGGNVLISAVPLDIMPPFDYTKPSVVHPPIAGRQIDFLAFRSSSVTRYPDGLAWQYFGFGEVLLVPDLPEGFSTETLKRLASSWSTTRNPWMVSRSTNSAHRRIPVVDSVDVPLRSLFGLVLIFSLLVGPINLWWVIHRNRRMWLLWTVPAASLAACLLVVLVAVLGEGVRHEGRVLGITLLDQDRQTATTLAWSGYYSSLATDGLFFSRQTEVSVLGGGGSRRQMQLAGQQHLSSGWMVPRLPSYFIERRHEARRERLDVQQDGDQLQVVNGLGADLDWLVVVDSLGDVYRSRGAITAGAKAELDRQPETLTGSQRLPRTLLDETFPSQFRKAHDDPTAFLQPSSYLASSQQGPFFETALPEVKKPRHQSLIYGLLEERR